MAIAVLGSGEERAGADPGTEQSEDEDEGGERAAGDEVVGLGLHLAETREGDGEQRGDDDGEDDGVDVHRWLRFWCLPLYMEARLNQACARPADVGGA